MPQRVLLFRLDAGAIPEIGTGHLARGLLVAEQLRRSEGAVCVFAVSGDPAARAEIERSGFEAVGIEGADHNAEATCAAARRVKPDVLVVDRLTVGRQYAGAVKACVPLLALMDHPAEGAEFADILINPVVDADRVVHGGPDYAVMRPVGCERRTQAQAGRRVWLSLEGQDQAALVPCLRELAGLRESPEVDAVAGGGHAQRGDLEAIAASSGGRIRVHFDVDDPRPLLRQADVAVVGGGLALFESVALGVPTIVAVPHQDQASAGAPLAALGAVVPLELGARWKPGVLGKAVMGLLADPHRRQRLSAAGRGVVDGRGLRRVAEVLSGVRLLPWDSEFFGFRVGRVTPYTVTEDLLAYANRWAREEHVRCLYYLADFGDPRSAQAAAREGYELMDVRVTLSRPVPADPVPDGRVPVRPSQDQDLHALRALSETMFLDSRFFVDQRFPRERCRELYARWVERLHREPTGRVFVAESDGQLAGFIGCDRVGCSRGIIGLVGVSEGFHGRGIGGALVDRALRWCQEEDLPIAQVVTQGRNVGALRLYEKSGFRTQSLHLWFHKWFTS